MHVAQERIKLDGWRLSFLWVKPCCGTGPYREVFCMENGRRAVMAPTLSITYLDRFYLRSRS